MGGVWVASFKMKSAANYERICPLLEVMKLFFVFTVCMLAIKKQSNEILNLGCLQSVESAKVGTKCVEVDHLLKSRSP